MRILKKQSRIIVTENQIQYQNHFTVVNRHRNFRPGSNLKIYKKVLKNCIIHFFVLN